MSKVQKVSWKSGFRNCGVEAEAAYNAIEKIRKAHGGKIDAATLVATVQKAKRHPLRKLFEWDDEAAGQAYRLVQARYLLRSVQVVYEDAPKIETRAYQMTVEPKKEEDDKPIRVYTDTATAMADPDTRAELLKRALGELTSFQRRFRGLQELAVVFRAVDELLTTLET